MKRTLVVFLTAVCVVAPAQQVQVSKQNKTISITAEQSMKFDPELARLSIGRSDYASSSDAAFAQSKEAVQKVLQALTSMGIKDEQIQTESIKVEEQEVPQNSPEDLWKPRRFHAQQTLAVIVPAKAAQRVLDVAGTAGANDISEPEWLVNDYDADQAKVAGAALRKARLTAEQMAQGLGARLGELVYASDRTPVPEWLAQMLNTASVSAEVRAQPANAVKLRIFPKSVEIKATVYATFAIE